MTFKPLKLVLALSGAALLTLAGCGGGDSVAVVPPAFTPPASTSTTTLAGIAATGAAFTDATVTVTDSRGVSVGTGSVGADGTFSITLAAGAVAPYVLIATRTNADGVVDSLVSVVPTGSSPAATATVNISPVTNLIASRLSSSGDPLQLAAELAAKTSTIDVALVAAKVLEVQTILAPILTATGTANTDPLTGVFATNGAGYDRLLDSIRVTITPSSSTSANIEVGIKQQLADGAAPTAIQFTSSTALASLPVIPAITASTLVVQGTTQLIAAHLTQLNSCFALPVASRISTNGTLATDITAAECKNAFVGNNPVNYLSNGKVVGLGKAFNGMFVSGGDGMVFSQGAYEFTRSNGDIVVSCKSKDALGNETFDTFAVRLDTDGKLKQIGNQYQYAGGIVPYHQLREFVKQPSSNYYSTGYDIRVPLTAGVSYVDVVAPNGNHLTMIPGSDNMVLPKRGFSNPLVASGTTFVRIRTEYAASSGAPSVHPSTPEAGLFFIPTDYTDTQILAVPNQAVWAFNYYTGGTNAAGGTLLATQHYKTRTRASTIAELNTQKWANLDANSIADLVNRYVVNSGTTSSYASLPASNNVAPTWLVPTGALPPTQVKLFGNALYYDYTNNTTKAGNAGFTSTTHSVSYVSGRTNFNDGKTVGSTSRTTAIACANGASDVNNMGEQHCANPAGYLSSSHQVGLHLWARDSSGREYAHLYVPYTLQ